MRIYCTSCDKEIKARLSNGLEAYPYRKDLHSLNFWFCDICKHFVGCHQKTKDPTRPLGIIADKELKKFRIEIHNTIDPLWKTRKISRKKLYSKLSAELGYRYHTANIKSVVEAQDILKLITKIRKEYSI